jgi:Ca2+-binding EF-hand superfamily protein
MKLNIILTLALMISAISASANPKNKDAKLLALLDKSFDKEQARIFNGRDKNKDGEMSLGEFESLYGEGGAKKWSAIFKKHSGRDNALSVAGFQAVRRDIHLGGGNGERGPSLKARFRGDKRARLFSTYDKSSDGKVTEAEWGRMFEGGANAGGKAQFRGGDKNNNGSLDMIEWLEMLLSPPGREQ